MSCSFHVSDDGARANENDDCVRWSENGVILSRNDDVSDSHACGHVPRVRADDARVRDCSYVSLNFG
jgi:hypothetical protein